MSQKVSSLQSLKKVLQQQKLYFITLLFALLYLYAGHIWAIEGLPPSMTHAQGGEPVTATVTSILTDTDAARPNIAKFKHIRFTAQLTEGPEKAVRSPSPKTRPAPIIAIVRWRWVTEC